MISVRPQPETKSGAPRRRGFTLVEMMLAGVITAFVLGSISMCLSQLGKAKNLSRERVNANIRANAAMSEMRRGIASITRSDDLFDCQFMLMDNQDGDLDRDELLFFNTSLRMVRDIEYNGEGIEYETQFRIEDDSYGPVLWQRRDSVHDEFIFGGGKIMPLVEGVVSLSIEAYDGIEWWETWDSDIMGMPVAVRIQLTASGHATPHDVFEAAQVTLRTVVPLDRFMSPKDQVLPTEEEEELHDEYLDELLAIPAPEEEGEEGEDETDPLTGFPDDPSVDGTKPPEGEGGDGGVSGRGSTGRGDGGNVNGSRGNTGNNSGANGGRDQ